MMRILLIVLGLLLATPLPARATNLSAAAAAMAPGTWVELTGMNGWNNGLAMANPQSGCTPASIQSYIGKAVWNPVASRWVLAGGIHTCAAGAIHDSSTFYDEATNTWGFEPFPYPGVLDTISHGYDTNAMDTAGNHYYSMANVASVARLLNGGSSWQVFTFPQQSTQFGNGNVWFPDYQGGRLIHIDMNWGVWSLNPATGATACLASSLTGANACFPDTTKPTTDVGGASTGVFMQYLPICQCILFGGGGNLWRMSSTGVFTAMSTANGPSTFYTSMTNAPSNVYFVDPVSGRLLALGNNFTTGDLWEFDPLNGATGTWRTAAPASSIPAFVRNLAFETSCAGVSNGVIMCVTPATTDQAAGSKVYLYKHKPSQPAQGPAPPRNVTTQ
jgi:hypothetical protein